MERQYYTRSNPGSFEPRPGSGGAAAQSGCLRLLAPLLLAPRVDEPAAGGVSAPQREWIDLSLAIVGALVQPARAAAAAAAPPGGDGDEIAAQQACKPRRSSRAAGMW